MSLKQLHVCIYPFMDSTVKGMCGTTFKDLYQKEKHASLDYWLNTFFRSLLLLLMLHYLIISLHCFLLTFLFLILIRRLEPLLVFSIIQSTLISERIHNEEHSFSCTELRSWDFLNQFSVFSPSDAAKMPLDFPDSALSPHSLSLDFEAL